MIRRFLLTLLATGLTGALCFIPDVARSQALNPYLGEIQTFAFNFCPVGWAPLNGQLLAISQNLALFAVLGTSMAAMARALLPSRRQSRFSRRRRRRLPNALPYRVFFRRVPESLLTLA